MLRKRLSGFALLLLLILPVQADFEVRSLSPALLQELLNGGHVLFIRHGSTDSSIPDQVPVQLDNCASQRPLTEAGHLQMQQIGNHIRQLGLPLGEIHVSPFCRAQASANAAFGEGNWQLEKMLMYTAAMTRVEKEPVVARTLELLSTPVTTPGKNRVLLAHGPNLAETMRYFPPEGTLVILRPLGNGAFEYLASIQPDDWVRVLEALQQ